MLMYCVWRTRTKIRVYIKCITCMYWKVRVYLIIQCISHNNRQTSVDHICRYRISIHVLHYKNITWLLYKTWIIVVIFKNVIDEACMNGTVTKNQLVLRQLFSRKYEKIVLKLFGKLSQNFTPTKVSNTLQLLKI